MNVLDLFSGIGGFSLGLEAAGMHTVAFCEREPFCQAILKKHWPEIPCHDDIKTLDGKQYRGIDVVCGGYPCQPFSVAGKQLGHEDERHLWPEMLRIIQGCKPRWVVAENVAGHIKLGFDEVAASLEAEGFAVWPFVIPACAVGAPHRRDRVWIIANAKRGNAKELGIQQKPLHYARTKTSIRPLHVCDNVLGWPFESRILRSIDGIPQGSHRLKALGNAIVPQIAQIIGEAIMTYEEKNV